MLPIETESRMQWPGIESKKFRLKERTHIRPQGEFELVNPEILPVLGRKHYPPRRGVPDDGRPKMKTFPDKMALTDDRKKPENVKIIKQFITEKKPRAERLHIKSSEAGHYEDLHIGIHTYGNITQQNPHEFTLEKKMGLKRSVRSLEQMRNGLPVKFLGDKPYGHPDYSKDYFRDGGLVPGANIGLHKSNKKYNDNYDETIKNMSKIKRDPNKLTWKEKEKKDARQEDLNALDELASWEQNTLKEANPKWRDPDKEDGPPDIVKNVVVDKNKKPAVIPGKK